jgi:TctA family transporter
VLGEMLEQNFMASMIKADGNFGVFFSRPIAGTLAVVTIVVVAWSFIAAMRRRSRAV